MNKNPFSLHVNLDDFVPATEAEKEYMVQMRPSSTFFKDGVKRLLKNKEGFTMEGLFHGCTLKVAHFRPAPTLDIQALNLRQMFADMQWEKE